MTQQVGAQGRPEQERPETGSRREALGIGGLPVGRPSKGSIAFAIGFAVAALLTAAAAIAAITNGGAGGAAIVWMLCASLAICVVLAGILVHRIFRIIGQRRTISSGARLHLRFVSLFSLAAVAPAVVVAVFLGAVLTQGIESWFSSRVKTVIDNAANVGRSYVNIAA
ncbi:MAG: hypothetical protein AB7L65_10705, partial [Hyphomonadaceae bacterium]